jgi:AraC-like DNA-binding protein
MLPYFGQNPPPMENLLELKFKELVLSLLANRQNEHFLAWLNSLADDNRQSLQEIMLAHYTYNLKITQYASMACKSVPTFNREFKKIFKDTPVSWISKKRLELAKDLLENSTLSIGEVAFECGYENQTHFSRVFKERGGISPMQFRKSNPDLQKD